MRILVVDDTEEVRVVVEELLICYGHEVRSASSGKEALALLESYAPDIVITNRRMPEMSGEELIRHIKESKPHLPIVLMTGDDLSPTERRVITGAGASAIVIKPFSIEELAKAVLHGRTWENA